MKESAITRSSRYAAPTLSAALVVSIGVGAIAEPLAVPHSKAPNPCEGWTILMIDRTHSQGTTVISPISLFETSPVFRTERAKRLWELRVQMLRAGAPMMNASQISDEIARRRGEMA